MITPRNKQQREMALMLFPQASGPRQRTVHQNRPQESRRPRLPLVSTEPRRTVPTPSTVS